MFSNKVLKITSGVALLASAPALVSLAQGDVISDFVGQISKSESTFTPKEAAKVAENSSFLLKFIQYALLIIASLYILGFLEKGVVFLKDGLELRMNEGFIKYRKDEDELSRKKRTLESKKSELSRIKENKENMIKEKERLEKEVKNLKNDPDLELLRPYINAVKNKENEKFVRLFELRKALQEFWLLVVRNFAEEEGFKKDWLDFEEVCGTFSFNWELTRKNLKWLDEFISKVEDPLSHVKGSLGCQLEEFQRLQYLFHTGTLQDNPLKFYFNSFGGKSIQQLSGEDFDCAQKEIANIKETHINDYNFYEEFKRKCDEYPEKIDKFRKNVENFKKAQEKFKIIRELKKSCNGDLFSREVDTVEEEIKKKLEADIKRKNEEVCRVYIEICECGLREKSLEEDVAYVKQLEKKLNEMKYIHKEKERLEGRQREIESNIYKFTLPGKYTLFY